jgi:hypothetical protein
MGRLAREGLRGTGALLKQFDRACAGVVRRVRRLRLAGPRDQAGLAWTCALFPSLRAGLVATCSPVPAPPAAWPRGGVVPSLGIAFFADGRQRFAFVPLRAAPRLRLGARFALGAAWRFVLRARRDLAHLGEQVEARCHASVGGDVHLQSSAPPSQISCHSVFFAEHSHEMTQSPVLRGFRRQVELATCSAGTMWRRIRVRPGKNCRKEAPDARRLPIQSPGGIEACRTVGICSSRQENRSSAAGHRRKEGRGCSVSAPADR